MEKCVFSKEKENKFSLVRVETLFFEWKTKISAQKIEKITILLFTGYNVLFGWFFGERYNKVIHIFNT